MSRFMRRYNGKGYGFRSIGRKYSHRVPNESPLSGTDIQGSPRTGLTT